MEMVVLPILLFAISTGALASPVPSNTKIIGGHDAPEGIFIYQASVRRFNGNHVCGGSIINARTILTARHCVLEVTPDEVTVVLGSIKLTDERYTYTVDKITVHEDVDLAIIRLSEPIEYSNKIGPIELETEEIKNGTTAILTGWGLVGYPEAQYTEDLQYVHLQVIHESHCSLENDYQICTSTSNGQGSCFGDSGGPLVANGRQIGIVSGGYPCATGYPDYFVKVSYYIDWIKTHSS